MCRLWKRCAGVGGFEIGYNACVADEYGTASTRFRYETERVKGSRFVADVAPASTPAQAEQFVAEVRAAFPDASHHCWAWRIGAAFRSSDDGEPGGSAGRPILMQIDGHALSHLVVVVTRWFGGTKLGVGGLMRAYGGAAGQALDRTPTHTVQVTRRLRVTHPYECSGVVEGLLNAAALVAVAQDYGAAVTFELDVPVRSLESLRRELVDRTSGKADVQLLEDEADPEA